MKSFCLSSLLIFSLKLFLHWQSFIFRNNSKSSSCHAEANFTNIFSTKAGHNMPIFLCFLMATAFGKNVPKYCAWRKSWSLKHAVKFQLKDWQNRRASFVPFTLNWHLAHFANLLVKLTPGCIAWLFGLLTKMVTSKFVVKLPKEPRQVQLIDIYICVALCIQSSWSKGISETRLEFQNPCS